MGIDRRDFLKVATAGAGLAIVGNEAAAAEVTETKRVPLVRGGQVPDIVVVGAGNFGCWTALHLQRMGASVTLVDQYGPGNSRSASGGETRGVRTSYGDRPHGLQWGGWAARAMKKWKEWDEEHTAAMLPRLFYTTGDIIMRSEMTPFMEQTVENWKILGIDHEILTAEEVRYRWPAIHTPDVDVAIFEPSAGVVRARRAMESVAQVFEQEGGTIVIGRASLGDVRDGRIIDVELEGGDRLAAGTFVFALGPWFPKFFPQLLGRRVSGNGLGYVYYFSTPPGDESYRYPNCPSYNVPGVTGWPALPRDSRGFRIRTGGGRGDDPDTSVRWVDGEAHARPRQVLAKYFPALADRPINETRACHYTSTVSRNFIIDEHPDYQNAWLAGGGSAESFKQGPVLGEYIAGRIFGTELDAELNESFRLVEGEFQQGGRRRGRGAGPRGLPF
jgi:glycine/D-amino acid oxidase-like deaminating enzyme